METWAHSREVYDPRSRECALHRPHQEHRRPRGSHLRLGLHEPRPRHRHAGAAGASHQHRRAPSGCGTRTRRRAASGSAVDFCKVVPGDGTSPTRPPRARPGRHRLDDHRAVLRRPAGGSAGTGDAFRPVCVNEGQRMPGRLVVPEQDQSTHATSFAVVDLVGGDAHHVWLAARRRVVQGCRRRDGRDARPACTPRAGCGSSSRQLHGVQELNALASRSRERRADGGHLAEPVRRLEWLEGADGDGVEHREGGRRVGLARCRGKQPFHDDAGIDDRAHRHARSFTDGLLRGRAVRLRS